MSNTNMNICEINQNKIDLFFIQHRMTQALKRLRIETGSYHIDKKELRKLLRKHLRFSDAKFRKGYWHCYIIKFRKIRTTPRSLLYELYSRFNIYHCVLFSRNTCWIHHNKWHTVEQIKIYGEYRLKDCTWSRYTFRYLSN